MRIGSSVTSTNTSGGVAASDSGMLVQDTIY